MSKVERSRPLKQFPLILGSSYAAIILAKIEWPLAAILFSGKPDRIKGRVSDVFHRTY